MFGRSVHVDQPDFHWWTLFFLFCFAHHCILWTSALNIILPITSYGLNLILTKRFTSMHTASGACGNTKRRRHIRQTSFNFFGIISFAKIATDDRNFTIFGLKNNLFPYMLVGIAIHGKVPKRFPAIIPYTYIRRFYIVESILGRSCNRMHII